MVPSDFVSLYRVAVRDFYDARKSLKQLAELSPPLLALMSSGALAGVNADITKADLVAAIAAYAVIESYLTDGTVNPNVPTANNVALQKLL